MPNTPAQIGSGMSVWTTTPAVTTRQREQVQVLLGALGITYLHDAAISQAEAFYAGSVLSLLTFLLEYSIEWAFWLIHWARRSGSFAAKTSPLSTAMMAVIIALPLVILHPLMSVHPLRSTPTETPAKLELEMSLPGLRST